MCNIVSHDHCFVLFEDDSNSGNSETTIYIAVGILVPLVVAALVAILLLLYRFANLPSFVVFVLDYTVVICRRTTREKKDIRHRADTTIIQNPTYGQLAGAGSGKVCRQVMSIVCNVLTEMLCIDRPPTLTILSIAALPII